MVGWDGSGHLLSFLLWMEEKFNTPLSIIFGFGKEGETVRRMTFFFQKMFSKQKQTFNLSLEMHLVWARRIETWDVTFCNVHLHILNVGSDKLRPASKVLKPKEGFGSEIHWCISLLWDFVEWRHHTSSTTGTRDSSINICNANVLIMFTAF